MGGTLTSLRPDRKPVVLWTPWGAVPKGGSSALQGTRRPKLPDAAEPPQRELAGADKTYRQS